MFGVSQIIHIFDSLVDSLGQVGPVGPKISKWDVPNIYRAYYLHWTYLMVPVLSMSATEHRAERASVVGCLQQGLVCSRSGLVTTVLLDFVLNAQQLFGFF